MTAQTGQQANGADTDQRAFFRSVERDYWAEADGLKPDERALIEGNLDPSARTLEAGTGGGRLLLQMRELAFSDLRGFDFAPELIEEARRRDTEATIAFDHADATALPYPDGFFAQALYLQQVLCTIEDPTGREAAIAEAHRILRPGGVALFSFVCIESRRSSRLEAAYLKYLRGLRAVLRTDRPLQLMPRLKLRGRFNAGALADRGPYTYWYRLTEAEHDLRATGLTVEAIGMTADAINGTMRTAAEELDPDAVTETLYVVCRRPLEL